MLSEVERNDKKNKNNSNNSNNNKNDDDNNKVLRIIPHIRQIDYDLGNLL